jgi:PIN domain nuclease of toxin-antitoxin system
MSSWGTRRTWFTSTGPKSGEVIYLDTHGSGLALRRGHARIARPARRLIETEALFISPVLLLELAFLEETGRIRAQARTILTELQELVALSVCDLPFADVSIASLQLKWIRDPFDRLIVAQALARGGRLVTKDRFIRHHFKEAVW